MPKKASYQEYLLNSLKNPEKAEGYLNAALEGGDMEVFLLALQNVVKAQGGVAKLSQKTHKSRTSLYKALSKTGNPYLVSTNAILSAVGFHFEIARNVKTKHHSGTI
jgi:probable addiction module antidote protein